MGVYRQGSSQASAAVTPYAIASCFGRWFEWLGDYTLLEERGGNPPPRLGGLNPEADRVFFRDLLGFRAVDVGEGWLISALPPAEAAIHPTSGGNVAQVLRGTSCLEACST